MPPFSLYAHIPYCDSKCPYCDFNSYATKRWPESAYREALVAEMRFHAQRDEWRGRRLGTVFLGGGTPSLFSPGSIGEILDAALALWPERSGDAVEITIEANPGTVDREKLAGFAAAGVDRVSFGAQSFQARHLARLGRIHDAEQAKDAVRQARAAGFRNVNLDLIFAVPGQTLSEWEADLATAIELAPDHLSTYNLTFEEGTPFEVMRRKGELRPLPEEAEVAMFTRARDLLCAAGYEAYEVSNFARPGFECRHNVNYWRGGDYLGVGAGAHSFTRLPHPGRRWSDERNPNAYLAAVAANGHARAFEETLTEAQARGEFVFLGLRCRDGFAAADFDARFGLDVAQAFPQLESLARDGLLELDRGRWRLTSRGLLLADSVFTTFV
jgi:oxygen-independent coproporphyrinogen-3 oxidase